MGDYFFKQNNTKTMAEVHDMSYYKKCMMGGILSCGITHTMVCPLDIVKCRMQANPGITQTYSMDSDKLKEVKVCTVSLLDGSLPLLDILCKDSVNSDFMKSSRMFIETPQERMSQNIELSDSLYHLHVLNSLLIFCFAHQRPSRLRCKHLMPVNSQPPVLLDIKESPLKEVLHYSTRVLNHFG